MSVVSIPSSFFSSSHDLLALALQRIARRLVLGVDLLHPPLGVLALATQQLHVAGKLFDLGLAHDEIDLPVAGGQARLVVEPAHLVEL